MSVKVSFIIPTKDRHQMLKRAMESVLAQSYRDFEAIVVADGSINDAEQVVAPLNDARIRFLKHD